MFPIRFSRTFIHFLQRSIHTLPLRPHLITLQEYTPTEILSIVHRGLVIKNQFKSGNADKLSGLTLNGKTLALLFSKRSTRTRVSSESGWAHYGGHCLFLGQDDIQTSETLQDTARVVSSMVDLILARVGQHDEILVSFCSLFLYRLFKNIPLCPSSMHCHQSSIHCKYWLI